MMSLSQEIAARATAAKFGGKTPDIRALARDLLEVVADNDDLRDQLDAALRKIDRIGVIADEMTAAQSTGQWRDLCAHLNSEVRA